MRIRAFILFICFSAYFLSSLAAVKCGEPKLVQTSCCEQQDTEPEPPAQCPLPSKDGTTQTCYSCPLLCLGILPSFVTISIQTSLIEKKFNSFQNGETAGDHGSVWNPPDTGHI